MTLPVLTVRPTVPGFAQLRPVLERALEYMEGLMTSDDVLARIVEGEAQWWPFGNSCAVTEIVAYPGGSLCRIWLGAGDLEELRTIHQMIQHWARKQGCIGTEIIGRDGWARALDGYRKVATVHVSRFEETTNE